MFRLKKLKKEYQEAKIHCKNSEKNINEIREDYNKFLKNSENSDLNIEKIFYYIQKNNIEESYYKQLLEEVRTRSEYHERIFKIIVIIFGCSTIIQTIFTILSYFK